MNKQIFELLPKSAKTSKTHVIDKKRVLIGRSDNCDICLENDAISTIHAVIEIASNQILLFDLNSTNGTYVNGEKVVYSPIKVGDKISFSDYTFIFGEYRIEDVPPPVLDNLNPLEGKAYIKSDLSSDNFDIKTALPVQAPILKNSIAPNIEIIYPLSKDPKSDQAEYIFEDANQIYPIFNYEVNKTSLEVILIFNDRVQSIDYIPTKEGRYYLRGSMDDMREDALELAYLPKQDVLPFFDISTDKVVLHKIPGFQALYLHNNEIKTFDLPSQVPTTFNLLATDIVQFRHGKIEVFIRTVDAPPVVMTPPIFERDKTLFTYILLFVGIITFLFIALMFFKVEEDVQIEKIPDRIATILYKQPLVVKNTKAVEKSDTQKEIQQKIAENAAAAKQLADEKMKETSKSEDKIQGSKVAKNTEQPKQKTTTKPQETTKPISAPKKVSAQTASKTQTKTNRASVNMKTQGHVEVYKAANFNSTLSSMLAKSGSLKADVSQASAFNGPNSSSSIVGSGEVENLKQANVDNNSGSLFGAQTGKLNVSKGAEGISSKGSILTAGIPSDTIVLGAMDPDVIRRILREHIPQFRYCYQRELDSSSRELQGVVKLNFVIGASGHVSNASVESDLTKGVKSCVVRVLRGIQFPEPRGGGMVEVSQPINFYPKSL